MCTCTVSKLTKVDLLSLVSFAPSAGHGQNLLGRTISKPTRPSHGSMFINNNNKNNLYMHS